MSAYLGSQTLHDERPRLPVSSLTPWNLLEMANTAGKGALSAVAQRVCRLAPGPCGGPFGARLSESPIRLRVWLTGGPASAGRLRLSIRRIKEANAAVTWVHQLHPQKEPQ